MKKKKKELKKIPSNAFSRGMSLFNLTVATGTRLAGMKIADLVSSSEGKEKRLQDFLLSQASNLVEELGKLKGSIMKAGQMLSMYGEHFFPPQINQVLKALQSDSSPVVWEEMEKCIRTQLGPERFAQLDIDPVPIAAASMGQVYKAKVKASGELLALKVQYPGVDAAIDSDLRSLKTILSVSHLAPKGSDFDEIFREIRMMLHYEIDYLRELEQTQWFGEQLKDDPRFIVPRVYPEFSTKRLLALSFEEGVSIDSLDLARLDQKRRNALALSIVELMFREIFEWRLVQTDPHFGNYKVRLADDKHAHDRVILFDFGAVRNFPKRYIEPFAHLIQAALEHDPDAIFEEGMQLGFMRENDSEKVKDLFAQLCFLAIEPFEERYAGESNPYVWAESRLLERVTEIAKDAIFAFRLRPPPREAIFLDRKMIGVYTILSKLSLRAGPRELLLHAIQPYID